MNVNLKNNWSFLRFFTLKKATNLLSIWFSYQLAKRKKNTSIIGMPFSMAIEPTTACNLRCPECPSGLRSFTRPTGKLSVDTFRQLINQTHHHLLYLTFYFQGEPYLHPDFLEMVSYAHSKKIFTTTSSNAHFLDKKNAQKTIESGLSRLIISIDGTTQETYESYRKTGSLEKVLEGTKNIVELKKKQKSNTPEIIWQFLVVKPNEHQIPSIQKMAKEYGVDQLVLKTAQIYDYKNGNELIPTIDKYSRYKKNTDGTYSVKNKLENHCWKMWHSCVVTWDGKVIPCCFDKDAKHALGNTSEQSFEKIWHSNKYHNFRKAVLSSRSSIEMCKNCTEGLKVWA